MIKYELIRITNNGERLNSLFYQDLDEAKDECRKFPMRMIEGKIQFGSAKVVDSEGKTIDACSAGLMGTELQGLINLYR